MFAFHASVRRGEQNGVIIAGVPFLLFPIPSPFFLPPSFLSLSECQTFHNLTSKDRSETYSANTSGCDSGIGPGWHRFGGAAGTRMPTSCPPTRRCNTNAPGWINGTHPVVADGQVSKTVCFHWENDCCRFSTSIQVRNCGPYYVYFFSGTPGSICFLRYCGTE